MKCLPGTRYLAMVVVVLAIGACVTINIYFPAEKVESVAGEIVQDIRGKTDEGEKAPKSDTQSALIQPILMAFSPSMAWAQDATTVSNATIRGLKDKMRARFSQMKPFYQKGNLKEGNDGFVSSPSSDGLSLKQKRDVKALVAAENSDRTQLYKEVAKALEIAPNQINQVAEIFAKEWQKSVR